MEDYLGTMIKILDSKLENLEKFYDFTRQQRDLIEAEEIEGLGSNLELRSKLMEEVDLLDQKFLDAFEGLKDQENIGDLGELDRMEFTRLPELKSKTEEILKLLKEINTFDEENRQMIKRDLDGVKAKLKSLKNKKQAYKGYSKGYRGKTDTSMLIDERK